MKEEIIARILAIPLSDWTGHYIAKLNDTTIVLMRGEGGSGSFWLEIDGIKLYDARLRELYYNLYDRDTTTRKKEEHLKTIHEKLCK